MAGHAPRSQLAHRAARKSGWPGGGAFPVPESEEEEEEEEAVFGSSEEDGGSSGGEAEEEGSQELGTARPHGRAPLHGVVTMGQGMIPSKAAIKSGYPGGGFHARKSGWSGRGDFPVTLSEEEEEEEDSGGEEGEPATVAEALLEALDAAEAPGDFAAGGKLPLVLPGLELLDSSSGDAADVVGLPLSRAAAAALKGACELAPFGRRDQTMRDTKVRHTWQLDPSGFRLSNPEWQKAVDKVVVQCCDALGVKGTAVEAQLYKLLLYEQGSHFSVHRDTEKAEGMWGTLVVHLPTAYEGGQLVVSHGGRSKTFDFAAGSAYGMHWAAFYADCEHEVKPVSSGHRLVLIYNLVSKSSGQLPCPTDHSDTVAAAKAVAQRWEGQLRGGVREAPHKLVYMLEHLYSQDGLRAGLAALKGADRSAGQVLAALQEEGLLDVHLALVRRDEWGDDGSYDESEHKVHQWVRLDGRPAPEWGTMGLDEDIELCQGPEYFEDSYPDGEEQEPDTGNEGAPCTRWYNRTALVVWPKSRRYDMRCEGGLKPAAEGLLKAVRRGSHPPEELREWVAALLRALPTTADAAVVSAVLAAVAELNDAQLAEQCLAALSEVGSKQLLYSYSYGSVIAGCVTPEHAPAIVQLCQLGGWSERCTAAVKALLSRLVKGNLNALPSCAALLRQLQAAATAPEGAACAAGQAAGAAGAVAAAAASAQQAGGSAARSSRAAASDLLSAGLAKLTKAVASLPRADAPRDGFHISSSDTARLRQAQARAAGGFVQLLSLVQELADEAAVERFLATAYARHFIATGAAPAAGGDSPACMLPALLAACQRFGWDSPRTLAVLKATAAACTGSPAGYGDFLELAKGVLAAAGAAAAAVVPQLTAALLQALPPAPPPTVYGVHADETGSVQALLDWLAEHGTSQQFGAFFTRAAKSSLGLKAAVDVAVRLGQAKGWWTDLQQGLLAVLSRSHSESDMPAVLERLRRVQQASGAGTAAASNGAAGSAQRYVQLAAAVVGVLEREQDRDMNPRPPAVSYQRGRRYVTSYRSTPSAPPRTVAFVQQLLLATYVPGCAESAQLLGRAAAHVCRCPLRYPMDSLVLPALEGFTQQLQLGSLAAAVQAVPAVRAMVQQAANALRSKVPRPPALPTDWNRRADAPRVRCGAARCTDCPAVRAFLESAQQAERRFEMGATRRKHLASALSRAGAIAGFGWRDDGVAIVCSKRGAYEAALAEYNRKQSSLQKLQAALAGGAQTGGGGGGSGRGRAAQPTQPQQAAGAGGVIDLTGGSPAAKKRRL